MFNLILFLFISILLITSVLTWKYIQILKKDEITLIQKQENFQKLIQQFIHDTKNPLATLAMAIHNLRFSIKENSGILSEELSLEELMSTINESISETTTSLEEIAIFSRLGNSNFSSVDPISFIENNFSKKESNLKILTDFPDDLPNLYADQQALDLVVQHLLCLCKNSNEKQQIIHISVSETDRIKHIVEYKFYNHRFLCSNASNENPDNLFEKQLDNKSKFSISIIKIILARHQSELLGLIDVHQGSTFGFQLKASSG